MPSWLDTPEEDDRLSTSWFDEPIEDEEPVEATAPKSWLDDDPVIEEPEEPETVKTSWLDEPAPKKRPKLHELPIEPTAPKTLRELGLPRLPMDFSVDLSLSPSEIAEKKARERAAGYTGQWVPTNMFNTFVESANDALAQMGDSLSVGLLTKFALGEEGAAKFYHTLEDRAQRRAALSQAVADNSLSPGFAALGNATAEVAGSLVPVAAGAAVGTPYVAGLLPSLASNPSTVAYGLMAAQSYPRNLYKAEQAGIDSIFGRNLYAALNTGAEILTEVATGKLAKATGFKTVEQMLDTTGTRSVMNRLGGMGFDAVGEVTTNIANNVVDVVSEVDPDAFKDFGEQTKTTIGVSLLLGGTINTLDHMMAQDLPPKAAELRDAIHEFEVNPTEETAKAIGLPDEIATSQEAREAVVVQMQKSAEVLQTRDIEEGIANKMREVAPPPTPVVEPVAEEVTPEPPVETPPPTGRVAPSDREPLPEGGIALKNAMTERLMRTFGREFTYSPERRKIREITSRAIQAGLPEQTVALAKATIDSPKEWSPLQSAGATVWLAEADATRREVSKRLELAEAVGDDTQAAVARQQMESLLEDVQTVTEASHIAGTEWGVTGRLRQAMIGNMVDQGTIEARIRSASKRPLSESQKKDAETLANEGATIKADREKAVTAQTEQLVNEFLKTAKRESIPQEDIPAVVERIKELLKENCDLE